jgi:hypothetical protein
MIPPADGLTEQELGLFVKIIEDCSDTGTAFYTFVQKTITEKGVIGVATVTYHPWINSSGTEHTKDGYLVWVTDTGHAYMQGKVDVAKPCTLDSLFWTSYGKCKRHKKYHLKDEYEAYNSDQSTAQGT